MLFASEAIEAIRRYMEVNGDSPVAIRSNLLGDTSLCAQTLDGRWIPIFS